MEGIVVRVRAYKDHAVVIRHHNLGEADRIVTLLTRDHGLVRAVVKGVRRTRSRFGARLDPFSVVELQLYPGRNLDKVTQAVTIRTDASEILREYESYTAASAILEAAEKLTGEERVPAPAMFHLVTSALQAIALHRRDPAQISDAFLIKAISEAGWELSLDDCAHCGAPGLHRAFHPLMGGVTCVHCRPSEATVPDASVLDYLRALRDANWAFVDALINEGLQGVGEIGGEKLVGESGEEESGGELGTEKQGEGPTSEVLTREGANFSPQSLSPPSLSPPSLSPSPNTRVPEYGRSYPKISERGYAIERSATRLLAAYLQWHTEKANRSLELLVHALRPREEDATHSVLEGQPSRDRWNCASEQRAFEELTP